MTCSMMQYDFVVVDDHLFDEAMVVKVRCGYDFVPVDRLVYASALLAKSSLYTLLLL